MDINWHTEVLAECKILASEGESVTCAIGDIVAVLKQFAKKERASLATGRVNRQGQPDVYYYPGNNYNGFFSMQGDILFVALIALTDTPLKFDDGFKLACGRCDEHYE